MLSDLLYQVTGYDPSSFRYEVGVTPFSTIPSVVTSLLIYFSVIFLLWSVMKNQTAFTLKNLFALHNILLTLISLALLLLLLEAILPVLLEKGLFWSICDKDVFLDARLEFYYYVNYLIKYVELLDTVFLVLKKKPLSFLHVYHHSLTAVLCFTQLNGNTTVQWVPITLNLFVHVLMYYYYFASSLGMRIWWKQHLTTLQITQFVIDITACYYCLYVAWNQDSLGYSCHGSFNAAYFGCFLLSSYLYLFIDFFKKTYSGQSKKPLAAEKKKPSAKLD